MFKRVSVLALIVAVLLGFIGTVLVIRYVNDIKEAYTNIPMTEVVIAVQHIPENVVISQDMVKLTKVPEDTVLPQAISSVEDIVGGISKTEIFEGEHFLRGRIYKGEEDKDKFSYSIPENMRAVSMSINDVSGVSGLISPKDHVDILFTYKLPNKDQTKQDDSQEESQEVAEHEGEKDAVQEGDHWPLGKGYMEKLVQELLKDKRIVSYDGGLITLTLLQNIEVLAIYGSKSDEEKSEARSGTITLALTPQDVEILTNADSVGNLRLSLRSPVDDVIVELEPINIKR